jgi:histidinol-phosphate/aromatic aminotransferase/cobyric acid decarboxylase-like protein
MTEPPLDYNEAATGPARAAVSRILEHVEELHLYPRGLHQRAEAAVAEAIGVDDAQVILTCGVDEATDLVLLHVNRATSFVPGFNGYWHRAEALGVPMRRLPLDDDWEPATDLGPPGGALFVAQPNNPTGHRFAGTAWLRAAAGHFDLVLVDETYRSFADPPAPTALELELPNVCVFRSFSKDYGLAALRIGALAGAPAVIAALRERKAFYTVDGLSLHGLLGALDDPAAIDDAVWHVRRLRPRYAATLRAAPIVAEVRETDCNFVVFRPVDGWRAAAAVEALADRGVRVTDCALFGMDGWVRVSVGGEHALESLSRALDDLVEAP